MSDNIATAFPDLSNIHLVGQGGQKSVYRAQHPVHGDVVLKIIERDTDVNKERLNREVLASKILSESPHIPEVFYTNASSDDNVIFVLEQYVSGTDLHVYLQKHGTMGKDLLLRLIGQMLSVLCLAESQDIVHRDIKPANVMIDDNNNFWLLDFGISRHKRLESLTATMFNWGVGTPGYCPVEQMRNKKQHINSKTDLFSLGILIYECASGHNPFHTSSNVNEVLDNVTRGVINPLRLDYDPENKLSDFVNVMTKKNQSQRPESAKYAASWFEEIKKTL